METNRHAWLRALLRRCLPWSFNHPAPPSGQNPALRPYYEKRSPSRQTIIDLFGAAWKSELPGEHESGKVGLFQDQRMWWLAQKIPGGLAGKSVLELGPFEGYHTHHLHHLGAGEILCVEGNSVNFLKCLCVKEMYGLKANIAFGDIQAFLDGCQRKFDVVCASGVLYHSQDPVRFIEQAARIGDHLYFWTHYFAPSVLQLNNGQEKHFVPALDKRVKVGERELVLHARSYLMPRYHDRIPLYWEGGQEDVAYWLSMDDLLWLLGHFGFDVIAHDGGGGRVSELPVIGVYARRKVG